MASNALRNSRRTLLSPLWSGVAAPAPQEYSPLLKPGQQTQPLFVPALDSLTKRFQSGGEAAGKAFDALKHQAPTPFQNSFLNFTNAVGHVALNPGTELLKPALQKAGVSPALATAAGVIGDIASPGPGGKAKAVEGAPKFAKSVLQVVDTAANKQHFMRIPQELFVHFKDLVDGTKNGIAGIPTKSGQIFHLTAKSPEQMVARGFEDRGVAGLSHLPSKVTSHTRAGTSGVKEHLRVLQ